MIDGTQRLLETDLWDSSVPTICITVVLAIRR